jgi:RNA polymerase sigma factor (sigma-70 family)
MGSLKHFEKLLPEFRAYARSLEERHEAAEDLVHDAIERSLKSDNTPDTLPLLRPWMFRIIRNLHYDELRKRRIRREYIAREKRLVSDGHKLRGHESDVLFRLAYEKLPADKREILFLIDIMGMSYSEAAEVIGLANGTVMSRLSRARQALRALVDVPEQNNDMQYAETKRK